jgi:hypothetical protein
MVVMIDDHNSAVDCVLWPYSVCVFLWFHATKEILKIIKHFFALEASQQENFENK